MFRVLIMLLCVASMNSAARRPKRCKMSNSLDILQIVCPPVAYCDRIKEPAEIDVGYGECKCTDYNSRFNPKYMDDSDYCTSTVSDRTRSDGDLRQQEKYVQQQHMKDHLQQQVVETLTDPETVTLAARQRRPPSTHHIIGGIIIPILIVFTAMGAVFVAKKMLVIQRLRNLMTTRRSRPLYEDVMMANDRDDPPLI